MSWKNRTITILSQNKIDEKYPKENDSKMARLTREFVNRGYKIVCIKMDGLGEETPSMREMDIHNAVTIALETDRIEIGAYTDMSELKDDIIYVACRKFQRNPNSHIIYFWGAH